MRLINTETLDLKEFYEDQIPGYAILSHRWEAEEVSFEEYHSQLRDYRVEDKQSKGFRKITSFCSVAKKDDFKWAWIDTCCIDKRSSAELSEAINSMFKWYRKAHVCYAYLCDVRPPSYNRWEEVLEDLGRSVWFTRGWTLQELLAPGMVRFVSQDWNHFGTKGIRGLDVEPVHRWQDADSDEPAFLMDNPNIDLTRQLELITGISEDILYDPDALSDVCIAEKMWWAGRRETARAEDVAYSLLGLFDVNMPLLYGEGGRKAFVRLQQEIMKKSTDQSIYAWPSRWPSLPSELNKGPYYDGWKGLLAPAPSRFLRTETMEVEPNCCSYGVEHGIIALHEEIIPSSASFTMTARGMQVDIDAFPLSQQFYPGTYVAPLNCGTGRGRCVIFFQELEGGMALKGDANYPYLFRVLSEIDPTFVSTAKLRPKSFCIQQAGFNDMEHVGRRRITRRIVLPQEAATQ